MPETIAVASPDGVSAEAMIFPDAPALVAGATDFIVAEAAEAIAARGAFSIALSGGNTPKPVYKALADKPLDWRRIHIFFGDERCVPPDDDRSNYHMAKAALIDHVAVPPGNIHRMRGEDEPNAAASAYEEEMKSALQPDVRFDLVLLGLGDDGHTASLFPGLAAVSETARAALACYVESVGMWRLTLTPPSINGARRVAFLVSGANKANMIQRVLQGPRQPIVLPSQIVRPAEKPALWLIDAPAAARLALGS